MSDVIGGELPPTETRPPETRRDESVRKAHDLYRTATIERISLAAKLLGNREVNTTKLIVYLMVDDHNVRVIGAKPYRLLILDQILMAVNFELAQWMMQSGNTGTSARDAVLINSPSIQGDLYEEYAEEQLFFLDLVSILRHLTIILIHFRGEGSLAILKDRFMVELAKLLTTYGLPIPEKLRFLISTESWREVEAAIAQGGFFGEVTEELSGPQAHDALADRTVRAGSDERFALSHTTNTLRRAVGRVAEIQIGETVRAQPLLEDFLKDFPDLSDFVDQLIDFRDGKIPELKNRPK